MTQGIRQSGWAWARDVLLTLFLPPLGLAFTGTELFRPSLRRRFSTGEVAALGVLFVVGVLLTLRLGLLLATTTTTTEEYGLPVAR